MCDPCNWDRCFSPTKDLCLACTMMMKRIGPYKVFFDQVHRFSQNSKHNDPKEKFAGANAHIPADVRSILDVGCGRGDFLNYVSDGYLKVGVDMCAAPLSCLNSPVAVCNIDRLPFSDNQFDLVTCFEVVEHLQYTEFCNILLELERVSRKYIIISVPNQESLQQSLVCCPKCCCLFNPSWHVRSFNESSLRGIFRGFRMIECNPCGPKTRQHNSQLVRLLRCWAPRRPPLLATCPQCAYSEATERHSSEGGLSNKVIQSERVILSKIQRTARHIFELLFIRFQKKKYWLLASYERTGESLTKETEQSLRRAR